MVQTSSSSFVAYISTAECRPLPDPFILIDTLPLIASSFLLFVSGGLSILGRIVGDLEFMMVLVQHSSVISAMYIIIATALRKGAQADRYFY